MTTATEAAAPLRAGPVFASARMLAARLSVLDREITRPNDPRWEEFWQVAEQFKAAEDSARRLTRWSKCIFGEGRHCPESLPVNCKACAGEGSLSPVKVIYEWVEVDADGRKWDFMEVDF